MKIIVILLVVFGLYFLIKVKRTSKANSQIRRINCFLLCVDDLYSIYKEYEEELDLEEFDFIPPESMLELCGQKLKINFCNPKQLRKALSVVCFYLLNEADYLNEIHQEIESAIKSYNQQPIEVQPLVQERVNIIYEVAVGVRSAMLRHKESYY